MTVSLIISTYNWPRALYLCLDSVMQQTVMPSEIIIADDGSGIATRDVVRHFEAVSPVPVRHIWHEDDGFRLAEIRNKAIAASRGEYVIQIDGDLILQRHFIQDHMIFAQPGCFVTGSRGIITEMLTNQVLRGEITSLTPLMKGVRNSNNVVRIPLMAYLYRTLGPSRFVKGCNMAFWRSDLIRVNGYDEEFRGWGGEDSELATRLNNSGVRQRCMKFRGIVFHLYHGKCDRDRQSANEERYKQSLSEHRTRCRCGLDRHLPASERIVYTNTETAVPQAQAADRIPTIFRFHMLVSVITPVYNTEKYLDECIGSILSQSMTDFELLLIDDGSTDGSGAICDRYAEKDKRIRVFHIPNGGVSAARNLGLDNARGEFVVFVDSDDRVTPDHLQQLADSNIGEDGVAFTNLFEERPASGRHPNGHTRIYAIPDCRVTGGRDACMPVLAQCCADTASAGPATNVLARHDRTARPALRPQHPIRRRRDIHGPVLRPISPTSSANSNPHIPLPVRPHESAARKDRPDDADAHTPLHPRTVQVAGLLRRDTLPHDPDAVFAPAPRTAQDQRLGTQS